MPEHFKEPPVNFPVLSLKPYLLSKITTVIFDFSPLLHFSLLLSLCFFLPSLHELNEQKPRKLEEQDEQLQVGLWGEADKDLGLWREA